MEREQLRKEAIKRYLSKEPITNICRELGVSRKWFYKWLSRYLTGATNWFQDESKEPKHISNKLDKAMENLILSIRNELENTKYAQIGASAIAWQIQKLGQTPPPFWTINRVLKRNGCIKPQPNHKEKKSDTAYSYFTESFYPGNIHQVDLVGPRYIKGDGRFYALNTIDIFTHAAHCVSIRSKDDDAIVSALLDTWKSLGIPEYLQFDNELSFRGSNRYPHSLGKVLKLCLFMNIQPIFIPPGEPWRNGVVEHFNDTFDKKFFKTDIFRSYPHLITDLKQFLHFHNTKHIYSANSGKTPQQILQTESIQPDKLSSDYRLPQKLNISDENYIHLIRFIRSDLKLNIWSELFPMPKELMYQYVRATIYTEFHQLNVFLEDQLVAQFEYKLPNFNQDDPARLLTELAKYFKELGIEF